MNETTRTTASMLHVDMDSFFASVELLERPDLVGVPVAVAHDTARSVVSTASYEARRFGVRSAMPVVRAKQLCPQLVLLPPQMQKYRAASRAVMSICEEFTPLVEPLSIDEAFLDVAGSLRLFGSPLAIAQQIRERVRERTGLPASVGLASSKFVAKLASQRAKPDGVLEIAPERTLEFLHQLPIRAMWGVGAATAKTLESRAIHTVGDLAAEPLASLRSMVGAAAAHKLHELSHGRDARHVETVRVEKSMSHEETFASDVTDPQLLRRELLRLSTRTAARLRASSVQARTIALKIRWDTFETLSRSYTLSEATASTQRIYRTACELFDQLAPVMRPVRLIGVRAENLQNSGSAAFALWSEEEDTLALDQVTDAVRRRFGSSGVTAASLLGSRETPVDPRSHE